ncbi:MAG: YdiU family protein [Rhodovarius sp.]|nr:YdiU family protein [Rhodovarius sp.]
MPVAIPFDNSYARLPARFHAKLAPTPVARPGLIRLNRGLAEALGLDPDVLSGPEGAAIFAGNLVPEGAEPLAQAYAGHQFGHFNPQLGDGRAILLGEVIGADGMRRDIQLKGSGRTPFSRGGDGRAALGPVLREYIVSEAMAALGIPTTRALAAASTGEWVFREEPLPGAVLTRVAASHIRIGTFEYFAARGDVEALRLLADYAIARHWPQAGQDPNPPLALYRAVVGAQARLVAQWMLVGFIHGVMNTDNCTISGETIDYGPCAFLDEYHPDAVYSSIDHAGRYAFGRQPQIAQWNLARLAEAMLPLFAEDAQQAIALAKEALAEFAPTFAAAYHSGMARKLGLPRPDPELVRDFLALLAEQRGDYTNSFRALAAAADDPAAVPALPGAPEAWAPWVVRWRAARASGQAPDGAAMRAANPAYIPRNHLVEQALSAALQGDLRPFETLLQVLSDPYREQPGREAFARPPQRHERVLQTFCGT